MIDRYLLRYFLAVIDTGNFSRAAARCGVSQPTLSVGIAKLERLLGGPVFLRSNRRVELTAAGIRLAAHARRIEADFIAAERALDDAAPAKLIRLGVVGTLPAAWIEAALAAAMAEGGGERLELVEGRSAELRARLDRGRIDAVLGPVAAEPHTRPLFEEGYAMVFARAHPLAGRPTVSAEELAGEPMIVRRHCEVLAQTSRFFTSRGVRPFMAARTHADDRALAYVRAGIAITLMPCCYAGHDVAMVPLAGFDVRRTIGLTFAADSRARAAPSRALRIVGERMTRQARLLPSS